MNTLFLLFSHTLTAAQTADARDSLGITAFVSLPKELQARWSDVPPDLERIDDHLRPVLNWLAQQARPGDYVLIQGDFGAIYAAVTFALEHELVPVYATTARTVVETRLPDGKVQVQRIFQHVRFRNYIHHSSFIIHYSYGNTLYHKTRRAARQDQRTPENHAEKRHLVRSAAD